MQQMRRRGGGYSSAACTVATQTDSMQYTFLA